MAMAAVSPSPPLSGFFPLPSSARCVFIHSSRSSISYQALSSFPTSRPMHQWRPPLWRASSSDSGAAEIISAPDSGSDSGVISALLLTAFIGLSLLTIGVIYLAVQDFLQKREREKFEEEESAKKKKAGKKKKIRARAGPRGFGQKIEEEDDD